MPFEQTFEFGWVAFLLLIASFFVMAFVGIWHTSVPLLWDNILLIFNVAFLPGLAIWIFIRLFPPRDRSVGAIYQRERSSLSDIMLQVGVCLLAGVLNFWILHVLFNQSVFNADIEMKIFVICNSVWEELFFCGAQIAFMRFARGVGGIILGVGVRMLFFAIFHIVVYGNFAQALISMLFMGLIYGVALAVWKRVDISMATHLVLNLLAS